MKLRSVGSFLVLTALGCGDDGGGSGGAASTSSVTSSEGSTASSTSSTTTSTTGGLGGSGGGGGSPGAPFTSEGDSSFETQTSLAADGQGGIVVVWVALFTNAPSAIGYAVSRDAGLSWTPPAYVAAPDERLSSNPVVAVDGRGAFTLAWLGFGLDFAEPDEHVYVSRLDEATDTFGTPAIASDDGTSTVTDFDSPTLAVDAAGDVLLTFSDFTGFSGGTPPSLVFARSEDGVAFDRTTIVEDDTFGNLPSLCLDASLGAGAPLYVVHLGANNTLTVRSSANQGMTWQAVAAPPAANVIFQNLSCVVDGQAVSLAYATGTGAFMSGHDTPADAIEVTRSIDGGTSWEQPVVITEPGLDKYLYPRIALAPNGNLEVAYYQGVVGQPATFSHASSSNGTTWTRAPIAPAGTFTTDLTIASWLGGYAGFAIPGDNGFVSYTENTQGKTHIAFAEIALP